MPQIEIKSINAFYEKLHVLKNIELSVSKGEIVSLIGPSGSGKTSIVHYLLDNVSALSFSVSACSRKKRKNEIHGKDYYFLTLQEFKKKIKKNIFVEWEQVYTNHYYGTLKSELERIWSEGKTVVFDVDTIGAINIKKQYQEDCLTIFIMPPSFDVLKKRLIARGSESEKDLMLRLDKAELEISRNKDFDKVILNDNFDLACKESLQIVREFIKRKT